MLSKLVSARKTIQIIIGIALFAGIQYYHISLWYVLAGGSLLGIIFGKVFCRWMCPIGFIMELFTGGNSEGGMQQMYMYHKVGCPIAWVTGLLNRISLFKIKRDESACTSCGICDKTCYVSALNQEYSLYKEGKKLPDRSYSCSKCLKCVDTCPQKALSYKA